MHRFEIQPLQVLFGRVGKCILPIQPHLHELKTRLLHLADSAELPTTPTSTRGELELVHTEALAHGLNHLPHQAPAPFILLLVSSKSCYCISESAPGRAADVAGL